jgi:adenylyltransferase/sulfurtransferase
MSEPLPLEIDCRSVADRLQRGDALLLIDCREPDEYAVAKIDGARLIPMGQLPERLGEIEAYRDAPLVVHCHHGGRSLRVVHWLRAQGFAQVQSMAGGIDQWAVEIDPSVARY